MLRYIVDHPRKTTLDVVSSKGATRKDMAGAPSCQAFPSQCYFNFFNGSRPFDILFICENKKAGRQKPILLKDLS